MGKVHSFFFFLYIMFHNIIWFNSVSQYSSTHALIYSLTRHVTKYLTKQARVSSPPVLQYFFFSQFYFPFLTPSLYTVDIPAHLHCSLSVTHFLIGMEQIPFFSPHATAHSLKITHITSKYVYLHLPWRRDGSAGRHTDGLGGYKVCGVNELLGHLTHTLTGYTMLW